MQFLWCFCKGRSCDKSLGQLMHSAVFIDEGGIFSCGFLSGLVTAFCYFFVDCLYLTSTWSASKAFFHVPCCQDISATGKASIDIGAW